MAALDADHRLEVRRRAPGAVVSEPHDRRPRQTLNSRWGLRVKRTSGFSVFARCFVTQQTSPQPAIGEGERVFFQRPGVIVSNKRAVIDGATYALANITRCGA